MAPWYQGAKSVPAWITAWNIEFAVLGIAIDHGQRTFEHWVGSMLEDPRRFKFHEMEFKFGADPLLGNDPVVLGDATELCPGTGKSERPARRCREYYRHSGGRPGSARIDHPARASRPRHT